jgi:hypothetical protein
VTPCLLVEYLGTTLSWDAALMRRHWPQQARLSTKGSLLMVIPSAAHMHMVLLVARRSTHATEPANYKKLSETGLSCLDAVLSRQQ